MRVFLTGGTGFIGKGITDALVGRGDTVVVLTRSAERAQEAWPSTSRTGQGAIEIRIGDPSFPGDWQAAIAGCDAVVNLAGEPLDAARWDARFRQRIHDTRIDCTRFVAESITGLPDDQRPAVLVSASGADYYGFAEIDLFDDDDVAEDDPGGESFLSGLCWDWEDETRICAEAGVRVALMRTGLVLGSRGAFPKLAEPFRRGFGGRLGSGRQWMSWIHIDDVVGGYLHVLDSELSGAVNLAAPGNVRNAEFARILGGAFGRRAWLPVPAFAIRAAIGPLAEYVLKGRRTAPKALLESGYEFRYPELEAALPTLVSQLK